MRQVALGQWPEMGYAAALGVWDELRRRRDAGEDLAKEKKRSNVLARAKAAEKESHGVYTVRRLIEDYLDGPIKGRPGRNTVLDAGWRYECDPGQHVAHGWARRGTMRSMRHTSRRRRPTGGCRSCVASSAAGARWPFVAMR